MSYINPIWGNIEGSILNQTDLIDYIDNSSGGSITSVNGYTGPIVTLLASDINTAGGDSIQTVLDDIIADAVQSADNGIHIDSGVIKLGVDGTYINGLISQPTYLISGNVLAGDFLGLLIAPDNNIALTNAYSGGGMNVQLDKPTNTLSISRNVSGTVSSLLFSNTNEVILTNDGIGGLQYAADYRATYTDRSLPDRRFVSDTILETITNRLGIADGIAPLNSSIKIDTIYLPSYVDDVLEFADLAAFPVTGESGKIYIALDTNKTYRWSGTVYVEIAQGLALGETSSTAYRGDRGKIAYDHSQVVNGSNPHATTFASLASIPTTIAGYGLTDAVRIGGNTIGTTLSIGTATGSNQVVQMLVNGVLQSIFGSGYFANNAYINISSGNNSRMDLNNGGASFSSNKANSDVVLTVNNTNASSTGALLVGIFNGTTNITLSRFGDVLGNGIIRMAGNTNLFGASGIAGTHTITFPSVATGFAHYNTVDQTTNYERILSTWSSNVYQILSQRGGTGTFRNIQLGVGVPTVTISVNGHDFGGVTSNSTTNIAYNRFGFSSSATSGVVRMTEISPTIAQGSTAGFDILRISPFIQTTGSGQQFLLNIGTNTAGSGAGTHTPCLTVDILGNLTANSFIKTGGTSSQYLMADGSVTTNSNFIQNQNSSIQSTSNFRISGQGEANTLFSRSSIQAGSSSSVAGSISIYDADNDVNSTINAQTGTFNFTDGDSGNRNVLQPNGFAHIKSGGSAGVIRIDDSIPLTSTRIWDMPNQSGTVALTSDLITGGITNSVITDGSTLALTTNTFYTFNGTTTRTLTLPPVVGNTGTRIGIINRSASSITLDSNLGGNDINDNGVASNTISIPAGQARTLYNNSLEWYFLT